MGLISFPNNAIQQGFCLLDEQSWKWQCTSPDYQMCLYFISIAHGIYEILNLVIYVF
jgi:hypothetical protein